MNKHRSTPGVSRYSASCVSLIGATALFALGPAPAAQNSWSLHSALAAPAELKLSGSIRARYEALDGQPRIGLDASPDLLNFRTTLFAEYDASSLRIGGELYDSRAYLSEAGSGVSANEVNALELVQAYVAKDFKNAFGTDTRLTAQAGRFTLNLGSRRLIAADDYRNTTNGYTGLRLDLKRTGGLNGTFIYVLPQRRLPDDLRSVLDNDIELDRESSDLTLWGGMVTVPKVVSGASLEGAFYALDENDQSDLATRNRKLRTGSGRIFRDPAADKWDFEIEGAYQTGTIRASTAPTAGELDVSAFFYHLEVGYQRSVGWQPHVSLEYDRVSGDDRGAHYRRFDTLFGMRRPDLAPSGIYAAVARANLSAPGVRLEVTPGPRLDAFVAYRGLWLDSRTDSFSASGVRDAAGRSGDFAGHQIDMRSRYWLIPRLLRLEADVVLLFKGRFMEGAPNAPATGDTHYASLNLTASF